MELPEELLIEILVPLPVKSLLRFKCVCKHWRSVIQSPQFAKRQRCFSETRSSKLLCVRKDPVTKTHVISVLDRHTLQKIEDLEWPPFIEEEGVDDAEDSLRQFKIFGPVNGIYCIHRSLIDKWVGTLVLWNPATREYKHVHPQVSFPFPMRYLGFPRSHGDFYQQDPDSLLIGFGYDRTSNDYKVVVICQWTDMDMREDDRWHLRVYNHASDSWRTVHYRNYYNNPYPLYDGEAAPFPVMMPESPISHCLINGVFHWACYVSYHDAYRYNRVLAFDMATDTLRLMKAPPLPDNYGLYWSVWVLKETIAAVSYIVGNLNEPVNELQVWMMMEYGVDDSWAMMFKLQEINELTPVGLPYDDRILFDDENGQLISVDFDDDHHVEEHGVYGMRYSTLRCMYGTLGILNYVETLTTLRPT